MRNKEQIFHFEPEDIYFIIRNKIDLQKVWIKLFKILDEDDYLEDDTQTDKARKGNWKAARDIICHQFDPLSNINIIDITKL